MVRSSTLEASLRGVTIPEMWSLVGPANAFIAYHREWHQNEKITVEEWSRAPGTQEAAQAEDQVTLTRHVFFMLPLDVAPSWFLKAIGRTAVPVLDDQEVTIYKNGNLLLVLRPKLRTPSHEIFPHVQVATLEWFFSHEWDTDGTVISKANVTITASAADLPGWLWALKPTIERVMIWQAQKSGRAFLTFCENRAQAYVAEGRAGQVDLTELLEKRSMSWACTDALETAYFDAEEDLIEESNDTDMNECHTIGKRSKDMSDAPHHVAMTATSGMHRAATPFSLHTAAKQADRKELLKAKAWPV